MPISSRWFTTRTARLLAVCGLIVAAACAEKTGSAGSLAAKGPPPDSFQVTFETSRGPVVIAVTRAWAPLGADRFYDLVRNGFFDENRFFRVLPGFVAQFGLNDKPTVNELWDAKPIADDSVKQSNTRGMLTYATLGPGTRTHQLFINLDDNSRLDAMGFAPIGKVVQGMEAVDSIYNGYGERPDQDMIAKLGNGYLARMFPKLDYIKKATITSP